MANGSPPSRHPLLVYPAGLGLSGSAVANVAAQAVGGCLFLRALPGGASPARMAGHRPQVGRRARPDPATGGVPGRVPHRGGRGRADGYGADRRAPDRPAAVGVHRPAARLVRHRRPVAGRCRARWCRRCAPARPPGRSRARACGRAGVRCGLRRRLVGAAEAFTSSPAVLHQVHILWPWFVGMLPVAGVVFALDGVLIGAGDVGFLRTITIVAAVGASPR